MTNTNKEKRPCPKHWAGTLSDSLSLKSAQARLPWGWVTATGLWNLICLPFRATWLTESAFISKNTGNLQPRQIWLIGSWVFDSNAAHLERVVLYLYQPAAKELLLLKWQRLSGNLAAKRIRRLICFYTFYLGVMGWHLLSHWEHESWGPLQARRMSFLGQWVCPMKCRSPEDRGSHELLKTE